MIGLFWIACSCISYGLFTKRDNDFCLMWSRDPWGQISHDWCAAWRAESEDVSILISMGGPVALPAAFLFASEESEPQLEFTHIATAYPGKDAAR
jgi:hypothetical protein